MIQGVGVDIIEIPRIQKVIDQWGSQFLNRIFTENEIKYCESKKNPYRHFAARFAAKEAVAKALATGWRNGFRWKDVEVNNDVSGKPIISLYGRLYNLLENCKLYLTISHDGKNVIAFTVIERKN